jgi:glycosyltransferase involved in cell wall biosynthesis
VTRFCAGVVAGADDIEALADSVARLLAEPAVLEAARDGARRARAELTWDDAAVAHLALYEEVLA